MLAKLASKVAKKFTLPSTGDVLVTCYKLLTKLGGMFRPPRPIATITVE